MAGVNLTNELRRLITAKAEATISLADAKNDAIVIETADFDRLFIDEEVYGFYTAHKEMCDALVAGFSKPNTNRDHHLWVEIPDYLINFTTTHYQTYYRSDNYCGAQCFSNNKNKHPNYFVVSVHATTNCPVPSTTDSGMPLSSDYSCNYNSARRGFNTDKHRSC